ncbi:FixH family protein [Endozoicomonadaceae bacterium StTr2]
MTAKPRDEDVSVWYKEPWPWFIIGIMLVTFAWGFVQVSVSMKQADTVVKDNYYKAGRAINADLARDKNAAELNLKAVVSMDRLTGEVHVRLSGDNPEQADKLLLRIMSPTLARQDDEITLRLSATGSYVGQLNKSHYGRRYIQLETLQGAEVLAHEQSLKGWRLDQEVQFEENPENEVHSFTLAPDTHL